MEYSGDSARIAKRSFHILRTGPDRSSGRRFGHGLAPQESTRAMKKAKKASGSTRSQIAAMPIRRRADGTREVLLVTSRTTRRWIVPKGWPMKGVKDRDAAAREAFEEAGVTGRISQKPVARYIYWKRLKDHFTLCQVKLYLLEVDKQRDDWAEKTQRRSGWFSLRDAADLVDEPHLASAILKLASEPARAEAAA
jgi:8-oxo-dGTP pyrophosphatase MutT (NUDIX family)